MEDKYSACISIAADAAARLSTLSPINKLWYADSLSSHHLHPSNVCKVIKDILTVLSASCDISTRIWNPQIRCVLREILEMF
jgi:hypothetical protein